MNSFRAAKRFRRDLFFSDETLERDRDFDCSCTSCENIRRPTLAAFDWSSAIAVDFGFSNSAERRIFFSQEQTSLLADRERRRAVFVDGTLPTESWRVTALIPSQMRKISDGMKIWEFSSLFINSLTLLQSGFKLLQQLRSKVQIIQKFAKKKHSNERRKLNRQKDEKYNLDRYWSSRGLRKIPMAKWGCCQRWKNFFVKFRKAEKKSWMICRRRRNYRFAQRF